MEVYAVIRSHENGIELIKRRREETFYALYFCTNRYAIVPLISIYSIHSYDLDNFFKNPKEDMIMSILSKKNFFERLSGSRLSREAPRMEATNNGTPSIVINKVSEKNGDRLSMIFRRFLNAVYRI